MATRGRTLRLLVRRARGRVPVVIAASISSGCSDEPPSVSVPTGMGGVGALVANAGTGNETVAGSGGSAPTTTFFDVASEDPSSEDFDLTVPFPEEGVPAEPGQLCSASLDTAGVDSGRAAVVQLTADPNGSHQNTAATLTIAPELADRVVGTPSVELVAAEPPGLSDAFSISELSGESPEFTFELTSEPLGMLDSGGGTWLTFRTTLAIDCGDTSQLVHAVTEVHWCGGPCNDSQATWVSSGDECIVCDIIAEMAPSPIVPDQQPDDLPLARVIRSRIVELARVSDTVILLVENDGGPNLHYEWHVSFEGNMERTGTVRPSRAKRHAHITRLAADVAAIHLEPGEPTPLVQVAVFDDHSATVSTWTYRSEAA